MFWVVAHGLFGGHLVVTVFAPILSQAYLDGTYGASAIDVFTVLLAGWGMTLLATPTYTALMAGERPWRFTLFIGLVLLAATALGAVLVLNGSSDPGPLHALRSFSRGVADALLVDERRICCVVARRDEWILAVVCTSFIVVGLISSTWWVVGLPLFGFTKQGWKAARSTLD